MTRPIQIRTASQGEVAAFLQRQREEEGKAARVKSARNRDWQNGYDESDLECEAWEQAAAHLLDEGREIFGSEAAAQMQFDRRCQLNSLAPRKWPVLERQMLAAPFQASKASIR